MFIPVLNLKIKNQFLKIYIISNAIQIHLDEKAKMDSEPPVVFKKMVHFSEIVPIDLLVAMDKKYDEEYIKAMNALTNPE